MEQSSHKAPHYQGMQQALAWAHQALPLDVPVGAVLIGPEGQLLAGACNRREKDHNPIAHAEMLVLQQASQQLGDWRLAGTTLYVTLEPCPMCMGAILQARVSQVVFGAYDWVMGACGSRYHLEAPSTHVIGGLLEEPCGEILRQYFQQLR